MNIVGAYYTEPFKMVIQIDWSKDELEVMPYQIGCINLILRVQFISYTCNNKISMIPYGTARTIGYNLSDEYNIVKYSAYVQVSFVLVDLH